MSECWLYSAWHQSSGKATLLYVGISDSPSDRMCQHEKDKWWWHLVNELKWERFSSRQQAKTLETNVIRGHRPIFNKQESEVTAGERLLSCLRLIEHSFLHCPICHTACRYSAVNWEAKGLCCVDVEQEQEAYCFEVWMSCNRNHAPVEWCQFIPIHVLSECKTQMPENVLSELWHQADDNGEVGDDIPHLRPMTLAEMWPLVEESVTRRLVAIGVES
jgi:hypothetical protein